MFSYKIFIAVIALATVVFSAAPEDVGSIGYVGEIVKNKDDCICGILNGLLGESQDVLEHLLVILGGAPGGLGLPGNITSPPNFLADFLEKVPAKLLPKVVKILSDTKLTIQEATEKLTDLLKKSIPTNIISKLLKTVSDVVKNLLNGLAKIVGNLEEVLGDVTKIIDNKNQTIQEQTKAINELKKQFPIEVDTIFYIAAQVAVSLQGNVTVSPKISA